ncbi:hypothetical protein [Desulfohalobium retbaense]|uniref:hypothetical protein n=1 Tax=Desulfohalobium retbaense TaxID=45663 RepID=UPI00019B44E4|nr:hypothetical protein [Desulfohalobium retbaense]
MKHIELREKLGFDSQVYAKSAFGIWPGWEQIRFPSGRKTLPFWEPKNIFCGAVLIFIGISI